jgi:uncharacterized alkaline shock family protein YloU
MNRENFNNLIFVLFLVIMIFVSGIVFLISLKLISIEILVWKVNYYYNLFYSNLFNQVISGLIAALIIILLIYLIWRKAQYNRESLSVVQKTSFGEIKISTGSIKLLALKVAKEMGEVKEVKPEVNIVKTGGININLRLSVKQDVNIPELSEKIQRRLKEYILETVGIETKEIKINIDKIFYEDKEKE